MDAPSQLEAILSTNDDNHYSTSELNYLCGVIEKMNKSQQVQILRILHNYKEVVLNENKYGVHVNLSHLSNEVLDHLSQHIKYVNVQETNLQDAEKEKQMYKNAFFLDTSNSKVLEEHHKQEKEQNIN